MNRALTTVTIQGAVMGTLWWPPVLGAREERSTFTLRGPDRPFYPRVESIREAVERTAAKDGDFQEGGRLTADTYITVRRECGRGRRIVERTWGVLEFEQALKDFIAPDVYASDFFGEEW